MKPIKYIFIVGGVMSGVGKGVASASIAKILQAKGYEVTAIKIDPYVNIDAGTMNPTEHGEVFVLDDGMECDQDMGNYERFLNRSLSSANYMTTGSVYLSLINKERSLKFGGKNVEVVPHVPLEVIEKINNAAKKEKAEIVVTEIGGTVGEYQNILFLEAVRMLKIKNPNNVVLALVSYLPQQGDASELKTKPTQYAVRTLNSAGLQPDIVLARAKVPLDEKRKNKIAFNCSIIGEAVISAPDVKSIYEVPLNFEKDNLSGIILRKLNLKPKKRNLKDWKNLARRIRTAKDEVKIGIVGKYFATGEFVLADAYISVIEAVKHAAYSLNKKLTIEWVNSSDFDLSASSGQIIKNNLKKLKKYNGVIVPGGFGSRGVEGKIKAINYLRENKIPFLGLCYGMQLATIEYARNKANMKKAHTTEADSKTPYPVIDILPEQKEKIKEKDYGGTMRLGAYPAIIKPKTIAYSAYKDTNFEIKDKKLRKNYGTGPKDILIFERHRHRYEINPIYIDNLAEKGLVFSGISPDQRLMEILELPKKKHPFFVATQFHPEFKSRPLYPHPLFKKFIRVASKKN